MKIEIKSIYTGSILFSIEAGSLKLAVEAAVKGGAVLTGAVLTGAVLRGAVLTGAVLRGAVLTGAEYYRVPQLHTKMLAALDTGGSLEMDAWHTCETTHCRAGWAVTLAGNAGKLLEAQVGPAAAGAFITMASCPWLERVPNFYATNEAALADIHACAQREQEEAHV